MEYIIPAEMLTAYPLADKDHPNKVTVNVPIKLLDPEMPLPKYMTTQAAGADICSRIDCMLGPGQTVLVPTGLSLALPAGWEAQIRPRSGLAVKQQLTVLNAPGTIDADYRGEVKVLLINLGRVYRKIRRGDRIAQMVIAPALQASFDPVSNLDETARGAGGFGHTGR